MMLSGFVMGSLVGIFTILCLEAAGVFFLLHRINRKIKQRIQQEADAAAAEVATTSQIPQHSFDFISNMHGVVWVLESEKIPVKEHKRKRDIAKEVSPVRKHAKIQDKFLNLRHSDSSYTTIPLQGCIIQAVSATSLPSRKWAKRYPIKVENKSSIIYNGSKIIYLYLETAWEKESWCKGLRLASCEDNEKLNWFTKLNVDFQAYMALLNAGYSSFMKPSLGFNAESTEKGSKSDGSKSKVKLFWKKLSRKPLKHGAEKKGNSSQHHPTREERKTCEKQLSFQDSVSSKLSNSSTEENMPFTLPQGFPRSASQSCAASVASDAESEHDRLNCDEGILCWNLLISRIFFDIKGNAALKSSLQARIQRTLSNMRIPNYIGEVICTNLDIGNLPPYIHAMRLLGNDMNEVSAFEVDAEYSGGVLLDVETRIEVRDQDFQKGIVDTNSESNSVDNMSSDLLEGFEHFGKHLNLPKEAYPKNGSLKGSRGTPKSRWKSVLNSVAKQVSQVPLTLSVRVVSLRGTLRLYIKPPPSDQLWFGFTSMPDIEFVLESCVGDHKITNGHIALFLINRFKAAIRETMVLPNCESACIPWMLAEKDDWVPKNVAPFIWLRHHEVGADNKTARESPGPQIIESKAHEHVGRSSSCDLDGRDFFHGTPPQSSAAPSSNSSPMLSPRMSCRSLQDLRSAIQVTDEILEERLQNSEVTSTLPNPLHSRSAREFESQIIEGIDDQDSGSKMGKRAKLRDFRKKMVEKMKHK